MQLSQFCLISAQSYLSYTAGPECGAPDWAKLLMILYMASMLVCVDAPSIELFSLFFVSDISDMRTEHVSASQKASPWSFHR